jgi:D-amino-acid oxidase
MTGTDVLVIGAGVIGLSTGVLLAERLGARVEIVAAELPQATTSAAATGMCGPVFRGPDERAVRWELATVSHLSELADAEPAAGVRWATGLAAAPAGMGSAPPLADELALVRLADPDELPAGFAFGMWVRIPLVDLPVYLRYLADRFAAAGGRLRQGRVDALAGAAERAPVLVNCTGVGAAALCADRELRPVRGQQVVVANPGLEGFFMPAPGASEGRPGTPTATTCCSAAWLWRTTGTPGRRRRSPPASSSAAPGWSRDWPGRRSSGTGPGCVRPGRGPGSRSR